MSDEIKKIRLKIMADGRRGSLMKDILTPEEMDTYRNYFLEQTNWSGAAAFERNAAQAKVYREMHKEKFGIL